MRNNSQKHTFATADGTPKHEGQLNRYHFRKIVKPWKTRKPRQKLLRDTQHVIPEAPRGRKLRNLLRSVGLNVTQTPHFEEAKHVA